MIRSDTFVGRVAAEPARPKDKVRLGVIGTGGEATPVGTARGRSLMGLLLDFPGVSVTAVCDTSETNLERAIDAVRDKTGHRPAGYSGGPYAYRDLLERDDVDAVLIASPAPLHARMAIDALKAGKDVGSEVPAGYSLEELWELVDAKEASGRHYILLENYNYLRENMLVQNMVDQGRFGETYFAECAYLHDVRYLYFEEDGSLTWRGKWLTGSKGNVYPTHAFGPAAKWFHLLDGDQILSSTSTMTPPRAVRHYARKRFGPESAAARHDYTLGDFISTEVRTEKGRLIRVDFDLSSPRPSETYYLLQGVEGIYNSRTRHPHGAYFDGDAHEYTHLGLFVEECEHPYWRRDGERAAHIGHGGSDFFVLRDFVNMVKEDREPWIDVYDAATWSALYHCSQASIEQGSAPVPHPDFTRGKWKDPGWRKDHLKPV